MRIVIGHVGEIRAGKGTVGDFIDLWLKENGFTGKRNSFGGVLRETLERLQTLRQNGWTANGGLVLCVLQEILELWSIENTDRNVFLLTKTLFSEKGYADGNVEKNRQTLQKMAQIMVEPDAFGAYALAHAVTARAMKSSAQVVQLDGVRWLEDEIAIRDLPNKYPSVHALIVYTTADFYVRLRRANRRKREGEYDLTEEQARRDERQKNEIYIAEIGGRADYKIVNDYEPSETLTEEQALAILESDVRQFCEKKLRPLLTTHPNSEINCT